jgi:hypothetical protein
MRNFIFYIFIVTILSLGGCKSDGSASGEMTEENVEDIAADILEQELAMAEELEEETDEAGTVSNEVEVEMEEVTVDKEKEREVKKAILKEQLKESPNLGKDCESILKEYSELVDKYISGKDKDVVLKKLEGWANDPIFNKCKKSDEYKDRFFDLEEKMYADEDEDL